MDGTATWFVGYLSRYSLGVQQIERVLVEVDLAEQEVEEVGPLVPPVTEQLGVIGRHDDGLAVHERGQILRLFSRGCT